MGSLVLLGLIILPGCGGSRSGPVAMSAAASTREALEGLALDFQNQTGWGVKINFGPSSGLAKQIEEGGPAEIFLSANEEWADYLDRINRIEKRRDLLGNRLVVVVPGASSLEISQWADLAKPEIKKLAIAGPGVPAGIYARAALIKGDIWGKVKDRLVSGKDVRGTLAFVEQGEVEAGLVYQTDAAQSKKVKVALVVSETLSGPIRYPLVLVKHKTIRPEARRFFDFLASEKVGVVFRQAGFTFAADPQP